MIRSILAAAALLFSTTGCAASIYTEIEELRPAAAPVAAERIAMLPVTSEDGSASHREAIGDSLLSAVEHAHPWMEFIPPGVALDRLNEAGLAERFANLLVAYRETGLYDRGLLRDVGRALGVDHVLQFRVGYRRESEVTTALFNPETLYEADRQNLYVTAVLWDVREGDLAWEAAGTSTTRDAEYERPRRFGEVVAAAAAELAQQLPLRPARPPTDAGRAGDP